MANQDLYIGIVQIDLQWHQALLNKARIERLILAYQRYPDLILLPEMFTTGFTMEAEAVAETMEGPTITWMQSLARQTRSVLGGSLVIEEAGVYMNRFCWVDQTGLIGWYDKRHLFAMAGEDKPYSAGSHPCILEYKGWRIATQICYDLRFPVWARNTFNEVGQAEYDLLVNVANWPKARIHHWDTLLAARAIENLSFVAAANRVGVDENGLAYCGSSRIIDYSGEVLVSARKEEGMFTAKLDAIGLAEYRQKFPFWKEADSAF